MQSASVLTICFYGDLMKGMELVGKLWRCFFNDNKAPIEILFGDQEHRNWMFSSVSVGPRVQISIFTVFVSGKRRTTPIRLELLISSEYPTMQKATARMYSATVQATL